MKTVTMVKMNGMVLYSWREEDGCFISHTPSEFLAFAHKLQGSVFLNQFGNDPHRYSFWTAHEIQAKRKGGEPLHFPVLHEDAVRIFELVADGTDDFGLDHDFQFSLSPLYQWVWFLDLTDGTFSVYSACELLIDWTVMRNYDIGLELGCDGVPCYLSDFWIRRHLPDAEALTKACSDEDYA